MIIKTFITFSKKEHPGSLQVYLFLKYQDRNRSVRRQTTHTCTTKMEAAGSTKMLVLVP
jgi:hypothetical protein